MSEYWNNYNPATDYDGLAPLPQVPSTFAPNPTLKLTRAGYDPRYIYQTYGDRLGMLPVDLRNAIYQAIQEGTLLTEQWAQNAALFIPELG